MHSFLKALVFFGLLASLVASAPGRIEKRSFKIERIRNTAFKGHNGPRQLLKSYRKFNMPIPQGLLDSIAAQAAAAAEAAVGDIGGAGAAGAGAAGGSQDGGNGKGKGKGGKGKGKGKGKGTGTGNGNGTNSGTEGGNGTGGNSTESGAGSGSSAGSGSGSGSGKGNSTEPAAGSGSGSGSGKGGAGQSSGSSRSNTTDAGSGAPSKGNSTAGGSSSGSGHGLVTATPETGDIEYLSPVTIGGQTIPMDFDSGSSDLWVFTPQLGNTNTQGHTVYDSSKSTSFKAIQGATFEISYGDGSGAAGTVGTDVVNIGGATVTEQAVELATAVSSAFVQDTQSNGLVGMAFSKLNTVKPQAQKTFFDNVKSSLQEPLFTADLRHNSAGAYEFGRVDTTKFAGDMAWVPINTTQGFWQFSSTKFAVGNGAAQSSGSGLQAIADTGTTLILASPATVDAYYSQVQGAVNNDTVGGVTVPCNAQLPDLMLAVGDNYMARVNGSFINFAQVEENTCFGGVQATTSPLLIYGDIFFKSQFVAFNGGNNSLGVAEHIV